MTLKKTPCCALLFMTAKNYDDIKIMHTKLKRKKKQLDQMNWYGYGRGETTVQCIVLPTEKTLRKNLIKLGFRKKLTFDRRKISLIMPGSEELSKIDTLSMYVLNLKNLKDI